MCCYSAPGVAGIISLGIWVAGDGFCSDPTPQNSLGQRNNKHLCEAFLYFHLFHIISTYLLSN